LYALPPSTCATSAQDPLGKYIVALLRRFDGKSVNRGSPASQGLNELPYPEFGVRLNPTPGTFAVDAAVVATSMTRLKIAKWLRDDILE
jgi:hypothetical protein